MISNRSCNSLSHLHYMVGTGEVFLRSKLLVDGRIEGMISNGPCSTIVRP